MTLDAYSRARAAVLAPCGDTITYIGREMTDKDGHRVAFVHADVAHQLAAAARAVKNLHKSDPEGLVPMCRECGKPSPCPTLQALQPEQGSSNEP